jgi:hypothetical protein
VSERGVRSASVTSAAIVRSPSADVAAVSSTEAARLTAEPCGPHSVGPWLGARMSVKLASSVLELHGPPPVPEVSSATR